MRAQDDWYACLIPVVSNGHGIFRWSADGTVIIGLTTCGRATVEALKLNNELAKQARALWRDAGIHPPKA
jgi:hypothetical protein